MFEKTTDQIIESTLASRTKFVRALFERPDSFAKILPYEEYLTDAGMFVLKDGSLGAIFELSLAEHEPMEAEKIVSVVEGVGKAVQAAQTTQSSNAFGGGTSLMTGDSTKYAVAGGASNAAGMVAQWYLQQAQNLAPTVEVGSGRDVWIVMKDKVNLPEEFFRKERMDGNESIYSYFTRVLE